MIDQGASRSFINNKYAHILGMKCEKLSKPIKVQTANGNQM